MAENDERLNDIEATCCFNLHDEAVDKVRGSFAQGKVLLENREVETLAGKMAFRGTARATAFGAVRP